MNKTLLLTLTLLAGLSLAMPQATAGITMSERYDRGNLVTVAGSTILTLPGTKLFITPATATALTVTVQDDRFSDVRFDVCVNSGSFAACSSSDAGDVIRSQVANSLRLEFPAGLAPGTKVFVGVHALHVTADLAVSPASTGTVSLHFE